MIFDKHHCRQQLAVMDPWDLVSVSRIIFTSLSLKGYRSCIGLESYRSLLQACWLETL